MNNNVNKNDNPILFIIMDGYGEGKNSDKNAIHVASTPNLDKLKKDYPWITLGASGKDVGLPEGQMGNSEVGHLNLGAGRIVYQNYTRINLAIEEETFFSNQKIIDAINKAIINKSKLHLIGLLSDGGVHSHIEHFKAILKLSKSLGCNDVFIHANLDGRDVPPRCAEKYIDDLEQYMADNNIGQFATISGRYYGMDRDNRWDRTQLAYDALTLGKGIKVNNAKEAVVNGYERGEDDEFIKPSVIINDGKPITTIDDNDIVFYVNFRPDRARQMTWALNIDDFDDFKREKTPKINFLCMCQYDENMDLPIAFPPQKLDNILGEILSQNGIDQLRIAETEKYAHVTFFFNGQKEKPYDKEQRVLVASPKVPTYDLKPEMSAFEVRDKLVNLIKKKSAKVYICNFANCDMVGHTGIFDAAVQAVETVDSCIGTLVAKILKNDGIVLITADHGNAEEMINEEGGPITAHTTNHVPFMVISNNKYQIKDKGILADIAPTILSLLGIEKPKEMTGESIIIK